jgi:hypothetical protein
MPDQVTCPRCQARLSVGRDRRSRWLTCPRCLSSIPNPAQSDIAPGPGSAASPAPRPPALAAGEDACPNCGQLVERSWRYCPYCDAPLDEGWSHPGRDETAEADVRRDTSAIGIGFGVLGLLGGLGMILFFCSGGLSGIRTRSGAEQAATIGMVVGLVLFGLVIGGIVLGGLGKSPGGRVASSILGGIALAVLATAVAISGLIYMFAGCFEGCGRSKRRAEARPPAATAYEPAAGWECRRS